MPTTVTASPDGRHLYATGLDYRTDNSGLSSSSIAVIDTDDNSVDYVDVGGVPTALSVSPDGQKVYVSIIKNYGPDLSLWQGQVVVLDATDNHEINRLDLGRAASGSTSARTAKSSTSLTQQTNPRHRHHHRHRAHQRSHHSARRTRQRAQLHHDGPRRQRPLRDEPKPHLLHNTRHHLQDHRKHRQPKAPDLRHHRSGATDPGTGAITYTVDERTDDDDNDSHLHRDFADRHNRRQR